MGETSNFYEKCSSLSKKGDEKSLRTLLQMGISGNKTARVALRKTRNKKLLKTLIDEYLDNIPSEYNAGMILNLAVKVLRKEYLYVYLMEIFHEKKDLKEIGFFKSVKDIPLDKQEQIEVKKYIIDTKDFDIRLISLIAVEEREDILYALLTKAMDDGLDARTTKIFLANKDYLQLIQPELREAIEKRVEGTSIFATYLDLKEKDNQKCIADFEKISLIYLAVKENVWDYGEMDFYHNSISIATKIDRNSVIALNNFRNEYPLTLYTYQNSFYHGKFYYIANDNKAFVIIGSSNISKTAYLNNYELDLLFEIDCNNPEEQDFINWFEKFKSECVKIEELNAEEYDALDWDSELDIYEDRTIDRMSQDEVRNKISELTDEDTKFRLNAWLEHDPAEIFSNIGVPSLQEYIVFLYPGFGLAVFESFVPGNAYYAFRYTEFEKLLNRVSSLTKTQMLMNSAFLNRGYHLQDNVKTKEKINLLFAQK